MCVRESEKLCVHKTCGTNRVVRECVIEREKEEFVRERRCVCIRCVARIVPFIHVCDRERERRCLFVRERRCVFMRCVARIVPYICVCVREREKMYVRERVCVIEREREDVCS